MTRAQLLKRLQVLMYQGADMDAEIRIDIATIVVDKRTRSGVRTEHLVVDLGFATSGLTKFVDGVTAAVLTCYRGAQS